jgi:predicted O-methyltransferase YrrM
MGGSGAGVFLAAFLFFHLQPLMGRYLLPVFGGGPAVWSAGLVFWQGTLLAGYAWAHGVRQLSTLRRQRMAQGGLGLVAVLMLPPVPGPVSVEPSAGAVLMTLLRSVALPAVVLASTAPIVQAWCAAAHPKRSPYRLYAVSNAASLCALMMSGAVSDVFLTRSEQARWWSVLFLATVGLMLFGGQRAKAVSVAPREPEGPRPDRSTVLLWWLLPGCGSALLVSMTVRLTADFAVVPFLWTLPLMIYLATWMMAFDHPRWYLRGLCHRLLPVALSLVWLATLLSRLPGGPGFAWLLPLHLAALGTACLVCHGELHRLRPEPGRLTGYYLAIAAGGLVGSVVVALLAPRVLAWPVELPLSLAFCAGLVVALRLREARYRGRDPEWAGRLVYQIGGLLVYGLAWLAITCGTRGGTIRTERNFFGAVSVREQTLGAASNRARVMVHGSTLHGLQFQSDARRQEATTYFGPDSGFAPIWRGVADPKRPVHVGVVGLGAGTLATYGREGDRFRFYEINPAIHLLAREEFTFLRDTDAEVEVVIGDARVAMAGERPNRFDLLVIDAFNGGVIPLHLLTVEALRLYRHHLAPGGVIAVHATNEHVDLGPPLEAGAAAIGMSARRFTSRPGWERARDTGQRGSDWWLLEQVPSGPVRVAEPFTDERASLLPWLK